MPGEMPTHFMMLLANHIAVACLCTNRKLPLFDFSTLFFNYFEEAHLDDGGVQVGRVSPGGVGGGGDGKKGARRGWITGRVAVRTGRWRAGGRPIACLGQNASFWSAVTAESLAEHCLGSPKQQKSTIRALAGSG